jgi:hypothetical protein
VEVCELGQDIHDIINKKQRVTESSCPGKREVVLLCCHIHIYTETHQSRKTSITLPFIILSPFFLVCTGVNGWVRDTQDLTFRYGMHCTTLPCVGNTHQSLITYRPYRSYGHSRQTVYGENELFSTVSTNRVTEVSQMPFLKHCK